jgi:hypothetical protein
MVQKHTDEMPHSQVFMLDSLLEMLKYVPVYGLLYGVPVTNESLVGKDIPTREHFSITLPFDLSIQKFAFWMKAEISSTMIDILIADSSTMLRHC